ELADWREVIRMRRRPLAAPIEHLAGGKQVGVNSKYAEIKGRTPLTLGVEPGIFARIHGSIAVVVHEIVRIAGASGVPRRTGGVHANVVVATIDRGITFLLLRRLGSE